MYYARGYISTNGYCTLMAQGACIHIPYFSSPDIKFEGQKLGGAGNDNARWIKENRFFLQAVSDELMHCSNISHPWPKIDAEAVQCMIRMAEYADDVGSIKDDIGIIISSNHMNLTACEIEKKIDTI